MAIAVKLDELLHQRRMTLTGLAERIDITLANLSILKTGKARAIRFSTLEAICDALGCQPGDILEFVRTPSLRPNHFKGIHHDRNCSRLRCERNPSSERRPRGFACPS